MRKYDIIIKAFIVLFILLLAVAPAIASAQGLVTCGNSSELTDQCTLQNLLEMAVNIVNLAMQFSGMVAVLMIVWWGGEMAVAGMYGIPEKYESGKKGTFLAVMGLFLILASYAIVNGIWEILFPDTYSNTWFKPWR